MKRVAIVVDNYKIEKFREKLTEANLVISEEVPFIEKTTTLKVLCNKNQIPEIAKICQLLEIHFKQSN